MRTTLIAGGFLAAALSLSACGIPAAFGGSAETGAAGNAAVVQDAPGVPAQQPGDKVYDVYQDPASGSWWEVYAPLAENGGYLGEMDSINAVGEYLALPDSAKEGPNHRAEVLGEFTCADVRINETGQLGFRCVQHDSDLSVIAYPQAG